MDAYVATAALPALSGVVGQLGLAAVLGGAESATADAISPSESVTVSSVTEGVISGIVGAVPGGNTSDLLVEAVGKLGGGKVAAAVAGQTGDSAVNAAVGQGVQAAPQAAASLANAAGEAGAAITAQIQSAVTPDANEMFGNKNVP